MKLTPAFCHVYVLWAAIFFGLRSEAQAIPIKTDPVTIEGKIQSFFWHGPFEFASSGTEPAGLGALLEGGSGPTYYLRIAAPSVIESTRSGLSNILLLHSSFNHLVLVGDLGQNEILVVLTLPQSKEIKDGTRIIIKEYVLQGDERVVYGQAAALLIEGKRLDAYDEYKKNASAEIVSNKTLLSVLDNVTGQFSTKKPALDEKAIKKAREKIYHEEGLVEMIELWKLGQHSAVDLVWWRSEHPNARKLSLALSLITDSSLKKQELADNCGRFGDEESRQRLLELEEVSKDLPELKRRLHPLIGEIGR